eukprot:GFUD01026588.1.p1 GENE.GFUD01026588.1~~GFUD01026588.1.p1  ORF type:complete len:298 (+),score=74.52 GFUD01026588.1:39-932(+)
MARAQLVWVAVLVGAAALVSGTPARKSKEVSDDYEYEYEYDSDGPVAVTCPGFPGYCSESYVGDTCTVVCARGRNNVPQCQEDGTWTDIPRCIEHDPGVEEQVTGICPGIPGYCSLDWPGALCEFECPLGPAIRSSCTPDGTWEPYPTCEGDPRETQDGCNPCPGPEGGPRNRTIEAGGGNGGRTKAANRGNNNIPRNGGKKQGAGGNRNKGNQNRNGGGSRNAVQSGVQGNVGGQSQNRVGAESRSQSSANQTGGQSQGQCPGDALQACIDVCPGFTARIFGACVTGCAKRCPARK